MEPYRVLIDRIVHKERFAEFGTNEKHSLWNVLNDTVVINNSRQTVLNSIKIYVHSVFEALNDMELSNVKFYSI